MTAKQSGVVTIKGREYKTVALRVSEYREKHGIDDGWSITTELIECSADQVIVRAVISKGDGPSLASGYAQETWTGNINKTSAVENCETSAIGRALAAAGYGGSEYATANEVERAISQQKTGETNRPPVVPSKPKWEMSDGLQAVQEKALQKAFGAGATPPEPGNEVVPVTTRAKAAIEKVMGRKKESIDLINSTAACNAYSASDKQQVLNGIAEANEMSILSDKSKAEIRALANERIDALKTTDEQAAELF